MKKLILPLILILILIFSINCFATPWDVSTAVYAEKYKVVSSEDTTPYGITFKSDGTKMYVTGNTNDTVFQYTLSMAWDVSTAVYADKSKDVSGQSSWPTDIFFKPDGTKMYVMDAEWNIVYRYGLSTAWDVNTATYDNKSKDVSSQDDESYDVSFKADGTKMYTVGSEFNRVYQYSLSTVWDITTATYEDKYASISIQDSWPTDAFFKPDGTKMYVTGNAQNRVYQYSLSTPWDVSTATYDDKLAYISSQTTNVFGLSLNPDGNEMYIMGSENDTVWQYYLPPDPPTNVNATDGTYTDKVVITWTKSDGAIDYQVYRNGTPLGWLGDVATYDDTGANPPTITPGLITVSDGTSTAHVALSNTGASANNGTTHTYKVKAKDAYGGESDYSETDTGYRVVGALTYQWYRSAGDSNADYSILSGATTSTYNDTGAPEPTITVGTASASDGTSSSHVTLSVAGESANVGAGRYYKCYHTATGAVSGYTGYDRGYRGVGSLTYQWQRSAADSDADYSNIDGAITDPYNDTGAPENGDGRYYKCIESATGACQVTTNADRGYRYTGKADSLFFGTNL